MTTHFKSQKTLKSDAFGSIEQGIFLTPDNQQIPAIKRTYTQNIFLLPLARYLAHNEKKALKKLAPLQHPSLPALLYQSTQFHIRSFIEGDSLHRCPEKLSNQYFQNAKKLLLAMRRCGVTNNDLAKEANWIITHKGIPAITDFQLALSFKKNSKLLRILAREDLRHLLKHKRKYLKVSLQEKSLLNKKSVITRLWMQSGKKLYWFITRKMLGWKDRTGPEERNI